MVVDISKVNSFTKTVKSVGSGGGGSDIVVIETEYDEIAGDYKLKCTCADLVEMLANNKIPVIIYDEETQTYIYICVYACSDENIDIYEATFYGMGSDKDMPTSVNYVASSADANPLYQETSAKYDYVAGVTMGFQLNSTILSHASNVEISWGSIERVKDRYNNGLPVTAMVWGLGDPEDLTNENTCVFPVYYTLVDLSNIEEFGTVLRVYIYDPTDWSKKYRIEIDETSGTPSFTQIV